MSIITFVNLPNQSNRRPTAYPPYGTLILSAYLKEYGHTVTLIDADIYGLSPNKVVKILQATRPDLIAFSLNIGQIGSFVHFATKIKAEFQSVPIVIGGPYVTVRKQQVFDDLPQATYAIVHEGEVALNALVDHISKGGDIRRIPNLVYKHGKDVSVNHVVRIAELDTLPLPDYELIKSQIQLYDASPYFMDHPGIAICASRGCPFKCAFCSSLQIWNGLVTYRSVDNIVEELIYARSVLGIREVAFRDDTLNARTEWFYELCDSLIKSKLSKAIHFSASFRVNSHLVDISLLKKAKLANFYMVSYGVESGNQKILDNSHKKITLGEIERAFRLTREAGLFSYANMMIGNIGESEETVYDSLNLLKRIRPDFGGFSIAQPFPGTELHDYAVKNNLCTFSSFHDFTLGKCNMRTEHLSCVEIENLHAFASSHFPYFFLSYPFSPNDISCELIVSPHTIRTASKEPFEFEAVLVNKGHATLASIPPNPTKVLHYFTDKNRMPISAEKIKTDIHIPVRTGERRILRLSCIAPRNPGSYYLAISLEQEGVIPFDHVIDNLPFFIPVLVK